MVVDDLSTDKTIEIAQKAAVKNKIKIIRMEENQGVGGAIAAGYIWCLENEIDAAVVMAGDGQMDPNDLHYLLSPVVLEGVNYSRVIGCTQMRDAPYRKLDFLEIQYLFAH